jgi:hypothetical protein
MITREQISVRQIAHDEAKESANARGSLLGAQVPPGCIKVRARLLLEHEMIVDEQAVPKFNKELIEGMENKLKDAILRKIYGDVAKKIYEKRAEILICVPQAYLFKATEAFNDILELLPQHAQYSIPEGKYPL